MAEIAERKNVLTASDDLKTLATSGSKTTATVFSNILTANRLGFAFR